MIGEAGLTQKFQPQKSWCKKFKTGVAACALSLFALHPVYADDTEIYYNSVHGSTVKPNLLFILDASLSMNWFDCKDKPISKNGVPCNDGTDNGDISRLDRMRIAMAEVLAKLDNNLNVGIMRFGGYDGGRIIYPISDLAEPGVREDLDAIIQDIVAVIGTPTVGAMEEAWRYFSGLPLNHGAVRAITNKDVSKRYSRLSHPDTYIDGEVEGRSDACSDDDLNSTDCESEYVTEGAYYASPVASECQGNYTILLSDGEPYVGASQHVPAARQETIDYIEELTGESCTLAGTDRHGKCGVEMTAHMRGTSEKPTSKDITTHAIGFNVKSDWIKELATVGGGGYYEAESSTDLIDAVSSIVSQVSEAGTTVVAPTVTVDQFTRLSHRKESYLALFKPQVSAAWVGNLKRYEFSGTDASLKDQNDLSAIDADTGQFIPYSQSFWSVAPDGADVTLGGAAGKLNPANRRIVSNLDGAINTPLLASDLPANNPNEIHEDNSLLTETLFGLTNAPTESKATAGQVCYFDNSDWVWVGTTGASYRVCTGIRGATNLNFRKGHRNSISAISVGSGVHSLLYQYKNGKGEPLCVSSDTDINTVGALNNASRSIAVVSGTCPGEDTPTHIPERDSLVSWLRGIDEKDADGDGDYTDVRYHIGDPLHSSPVVVSYGVEDGETQDEDDLNSLVFFGTNEGFLHAIDASEGTEEYAFMPRELLLNAATLFINNDLERDEVKPYGVDGDITLRTIDQNSNGIIESDQGDRAYLYFGLRRGGNSYYALDVSVRENPIFMWSIDGGTDDFTELGQSWSKPNVTKVKINNDVADVLVFAGGYDAAQDDKNVRSADTQGRAIFMVDADTGDLVWSAGPAENQSFYSGKHFEFENMDYSIPADLAIVQDLQTGYLSQMYVGDMGGQLWRFDINNGSALADLVDGGVIADFGEDGSTTGARRFFATPDLSLLRDSNSELQLNIGIGSGYRAHPLNMNIDDKFFLYQYPFAGHGDNYGILQDDDSYDQATLYDLFDTTDNVIGEGSDEDRDQAKLDLAESHGWYITMEDSGEKILDRAATFEGVIRFVSYVPSVPEGPCDPSLGNSFFYAVNLEDGTPYEDIDIGDDDDEENTTVNTQEKEFRRHEIPTPGIAPPVTTIFVEEQGEITPTDVSGVNTIHEWTNIELIKRWYWAENPD